VAILYYPLTGLLALFPALLSLLLSLGRGLYLPTQSQASYRSASSSPSARHPSSCFDVGNEKADAHENVVVAYRHADVRASAAMTNDNDNNADEGDFDDTLGEILGPSSMATPSLDLDLVFCAIKIFPYWWLFCNKLFFLSLW